MTPGPTLVTPGLNYWVDALLACGFAKDLFWLWNAVQRCENTPVGARWCVCGEVSRWCLKGRFSRTSKKKKKRFRNPAVVFCRCLCLRDWSTRSYLVWRWCFSCYSSCLAWHIPYLWMILALFFIIYVFIIRILISRTVVSNCSKVEMNSKTSRELCLFHYTYFEHVDHLTVCTMIVNIVVRVGYFIHLWVINWKMALWVAMTLSVFKCMILSLKMCLKVFP